MTSFVYLRFLDTMLYIGQSFFSIALVLKYKVTSESWFYQTWFLSLWIFLDFFPNTASSQNKVKQNKK
jgi:hypothetical protein